MKEGGEAEEEQGVEMKAKVEARRTSGRQEHVQVELKNGERGLRHA